MTRRGNAADLRQPRAGARLAPVWIPSGSRYSYLACAGLSALLQAASLLAGASAGYERGSEDPPQHSRSDRADRPLRISIRSARRLRDYYLFIPGSIAPDMPAPVLLLLHGSYSTPLDVLPQWTEVAEHAGIILVAPKSFADYGWRIHDDPPALLRDIVDDLAARRPIDRRRLYLFGHPAGAVHALMLGLSSHSISPRSRCTPAPGRNATIST